LLRAPGKGWVCQGSKEGRKGERRFPEFGKEVREDNPADDAMAGIMWKRRECFQFDKKA